MTLYNNKAGDGLDDQKNNRWERDIRPSNTGGGGLRASQMLIDEFPMADGKIPASSASAYSKLEVSAESYDNTLPFVDRDPRFYRTFAFPGFRWTYNGNYAEKDSKSPSGSSYVLWNYVWYTSKMMQVMLRVVNIMVQITC